MIAWIVVAAGGALLLLGLVTLASRGQGRDRAGPSNSDGASWSGSDGAASCDSGDGGGGCD